MAGPLKRLNSSLGRWWDGHKDNHFRIVSWVTILSMAATIWGILFLFILDGTSDPTKAEWVPWSWAGLFFGGLIAFWMVPELSLIHISEPTRSRGMEYSGVCL